MNIREKTTDIRRLISNNKHQMSDIRQQTSDIGHRLLTCSNKHQMSDQTSEHKHKTSDEHQRKDALQLHADLSVYFRNGHNRWIGVKL